MRNKELIRHYERKLKTLHTMRRDSKKLGDKERESLLCEEIEKYLDLIETIK